MKQNFFPEKPVGYQAGNQPDSSDQGKSDSEPQKGFLQEIE